MASIRKRRGKYQVRIHRKGYPAFSKTFLTRVDAQRWGREMEIQLERDGLPSPDTSLSQLLTRYLDTVTPSKKNFRVETQRLKTWVKDPLGSKEIHTIAAPELATWRNRRLSEGLSGSTVRNYLATLSAVYRHAASEWGYQHLETPVARLKRPSPGKARTRRASDEEISQVKVATDSAYLPALIDLAIETGMRLSELVGMRWDNLDLEARTVFLPDTKNGHPRTVPLSSRAVQTLRNLHQGAVQRLDGALFPLTPHSVTVAFRRACKRVQKASGGRLAVNLRFHDLRHEAVSRLFERGLTPMEVAAISGHRSMQMLARYTHISPTTLLTKLG